ncbi:MAG: hypothetical protein WAO02_04275 [Verrucomicrobiia bacterium]
MIIKQARFLTCAAAPTFVAATVAALQKRANELASQMVRPLLLEVEVKAIMQRQHLPPALPSEAFEFDNDAFNNTGN